MSPRRLTVPRVIAAAAVLAAVACLILPGPDGFDRTAWQGLGLAILAAGLWATAALPAHVTTLCFFLLAIVFRVAPPDVVFAGFHSGAVWMIFGGIIIAAAVQRTGLSAWMADLVVGRLGGSYAGVLVGTAVVTLGLAFVVPSAMARTFLLIPPILALADRLGLPEGSRGRTAMVMAMSMANVGPPLAILPGTASNLVLAGAVESVYGTVLNYGPFIALHMPVLGLGSLIVTVGIALLLFRDRLKPRTGIETASPFTAEARRLSLLLLLTLVLWATDSLHGVAPAWVGLGAAILMILPGIALVPADALRKDLDYGPWFFVAGAIGLGAIVEHSGLGGELSQVVLKVAGFRSGEDAFNFAKIMAINAAVANAIAVSGAPAVLTPLAGDIAQATGWPLTTVLMTQVVANAAILLPYQGPSVLVGVTLARIRYGDAVRFCLLYSLAYFLLVVPLQFLWWRLLGLFAS